VLAEYPVVDLAPLDGAIAEDFMRGVDISNCYIIEQAGGVFYDHDGNPKDIIEILKENGVNWVRLRLWHNHRMAQNPAPYAGDGDNDMVKTKAIARRAKAAGMKFLLNFHYSDNWADPGRQQIPAAWAGYNADQLVNAVYEYTFDTILELKAAGAEPDMVQLGNEITPGLLSPVIGGNWANVARVLNSGAQAVRLASPEAEIMLHLDRGGDVGAYQTWFDRFSKRSDNGAAAGITEVDYDVIGLSWYPYYSSHQTLDGLYDNIRNIKSRYGKEAVVAETGWAWITEFDGDELSNLFHHAQENLSALQLTDANFFLTNSEIVFTEATAERSRHLPASPENQAKVLRAVFDATVAAGGVGLFWWAADWIPITGLRSNWDNQTLFDFDGKALPALRIMDIREAGTVAPARPVNLAASVSFDSCLLTWKKTVSADKYEIQRGQSEEGPWITLNAGLPAAENPQYNETGLVPGTFYYYRIRASNIHGWGNYSVPLQTATTALSAPGNFRIYEITENSVTLIWNPITGITGYKLYHKTAETEPSETEYTILAEISGTDTDYTHSGLNAGEMHWYRISAVYDIYGEGLLSPARYAITGVAPDYKAVINMATGTLDADFLDQEKAAFSTNVRAKTNESAVYTFSGIYAANDETNLYIAMVTPDNFGGFENDRIIILIDNTNSSSGEATIPQNSDARIAITENINGTVETRVYLKLLDWQAGPKGVTGAAQNITSWTRTSNIFKPTTPAGSPQVIKISVPLAGISGVKKGDTLKIFAAFSMGWDQGPYPGSFAPQNAVSAFSDTWANPPTSSITVNMAEALAYTVK